mgnify:FL=1
MNKILNIAVDAMGGEGSPKKALDGILQHTNTTKNINYNIFGDQRQIEKILPKKLDNNSYNLIHTNDQILDTDSPLSAAKKGKDTSMWKAIESVKEKKSDIVISAGNTGALFVLAKLNLKMIENIDKPALSALWPNKNGMNVVLDLGANIECNEKNLLDFSIMGSSLFKALFPDEVAKVALLNIGSEELKGNEVIKNAFKLLKEKKSSDFLFKGYVEGNHIMSGDANVIITDGFTGNIALKTAEGTANFIMKEVKDSMTSNLFGKFLTLLNIKNLKKVKDKLDPRLYNGAILIGLDSPVVKSHGSTDSLGFSYSLKVCERIINGNLIDKIKKNLIL